MGRDGFNDFLLEVIQNEEVSSVLAITKKDLGSLSKLCEGSLKSLSIMNLAHLDSNNAESICISLTEETIRQNWR